jgi:DNA-binding MarR family transcriptional regulator
VRRRSVIESLITSKTRIKLLLKFFINPGTTAYLRSLAEELGESTNGVRIELDRLSEAGLLERSDNGRTKLYRANAKHPLFPEIRRIIAKHVGIDKLIDQVLAKLGKVESAYITGDYAQGKDTGIIDLVVVGDIDMAYFQSLVDKAEKLIRRKIRYLVLPGKEFPRVRDMLGLERAIIVWEEQKGRTRRAAPEREIL